jgi:hypothetical protein
MTPPTPPVNVSILGPNSDGTLKVNTNSFINDPKTNGGGSVIVADFNGDGKQDIFLAAHNESPFIAMPSTAYISNNTNFFTKVVLNDHVMAHDAELALINGKPIVIASTFNPGDVNPIYTFSNGNFIETIYPELNLPGMDAAIVNSGNGKYHLVRGDAGEGYNSQTQKSTAQNIQVFNFDPSTLNVSSTQLIQNIVPYLSTLPQYKNFPAEIGGTGLTHTYRLWADDLNNDGSQDLLAGESMWSQSSREFPSILQVLINNGNGTFKDATLKLNPEMKFNTSEMDYRPNFIDIDNSGIKTYFFAGSTSWGSMPRQSDYILINDGTGRLYIAIHDQFSFFADKIFKYLGKWYNQSSTPPRFIAIPQLDGSVNFVAEVPSNGLPMNGINNVAAYQFINVPIRYNPKTDFTQNITVSDRNNSMLMRTWAGNDVFYDTNANSKPTKIDGGLGNNKAIYSGSSAQYLVTRNSNGTATVMSNSSAPVQVNDTLTNIQQIQFSDKTINLN